MLQDLADPAWILGERLKPALTAMAELDLCFDALVRPVHLQPLLKFSTQNPELRVVVDHGAKPDIRSGDLKLWARELRILARETSVHCKLSGLVTEARPDWHTRDLEYCIRHIVESFGPDRIMWGSDWPVVEIAGGYRRWHEAANDCLQELSVDERSRIFGSNAARFYGFAQAD
jgi:L-fuconolactonase